MARNTRGLTPALLGPITLVRDSDVSSPILLPEDIRGALINVTTAERDSIDGRKLDNNMIVYNTTNDRYERYTGGGARDRSGFISGGTWEALDLGVDTDATGVQSIAFDHQSRTFSLVETNAEVHTARIPGFTIYDSDTSYARNETVFHDGKIYYWDSDVPATPHTTPGTEGVITIPGVTQQSTFVVNTIPQRNPSGFNVFVDTDEANVLVRTENTFRNFGQVLSSAAVMGDTDVYRITVVGTSGFLTTYRIDWQTLGPKGNNVNHGLVLAYGEPGHPIQLLRRGSFDQHFRNHWVELSVDSDTFATNLIFDHQSRNLSLFQGNDTVLETRIPGFTIYDSDASYARNETVFHNDEIFYWDSDVAATPHSIPAGEGSVISVPGVTQQTFFVVEDFIPVSPNGFRVFTGPDTDSIRSVVFSGAVNFQEIANSNAVRRDSDIYTITRIGSAGGTLAEYRLDWVSTGPKGDTENNGLILVNTPPDAPAPSGTNRRGSNDTVVSNHWIRLSSTGDSEEDVSAVSMSYDSERISTTLTFNDDTTITSNEITIPNVSASAPGFVPVPAAPDGNSAHYFGGDLQWHHLSGLDTDSIYDFGYGLIVNDDTDGRDNVVVNTRQIATRDWILGDFLRVQTHHQLRLDDTDTVKITLGQGLDSELPGEVRIDFRKIDTEDTSNLQARVAIVAPSGAATSVSANAASAADLAQSFRFHINGVPGAGIPQAIPHVNARDTDASTDTEASLIITFMDSEIGPGFTVAADAITKKTLSTTVTVLNDGIADIPDSFIELNDITLPVFSDAKDGVVPSPSLDENSGTHYLGGDGQWHHFTSRVLDSEHVFTLDTDGLVPAPGTHDTDNAIRFMNANGEWVIVQHTLSDTELSISYNDTDREITLKGRGTGLTPAVDSERQVVVMSFDAPPGVSDHEMTVRFFQPDTDTDTYFDSTFNDGGANDWAGSPAHVYRDVKPAITNVTAYQYRGMNLFVQVDTDDVNHTFTLTYNIPGYVNYGTGPSFRVTDSGVDAVGVITTRGRPYIPPMPDTNSDYVISMAQLPLFDTDDTTAGLVPGSNGNGEEYYLSGAGTWRHLTSNNDSDEWELTINDANDITLSDRHNNNSTVTISTFDHDHRGLVPSSGAETGADRVLASTGEWISVENLLDTDVNIDYEAAERLLEVEVLTTTITPDRGEPIVYVTEWIARTDTLPATGPITVSLPYRDSDDTFGYINFTVDTDVATLNSADFNDRFAPIVNESRVLNASSLGVSGTRVTGVFAGPIPYYDLNLDVISPTNWTVVPKVITEGRVPQGGPHTDTSYRVISSTELPLFDTDNTNAGLVPGSNGANSDYFLSADGTWRHSGTILSDTDLAIKYDDTDREIILEGFGEVYYPAVDSERQVVVMSFNAPAGISQDTLTVHLFQPDTDSDTFFTTDFNDGGAGDWAGNPAAVYRDVKPAITNVTAYQYRGMNLFSSVVADDDNHTFTLTYNIPGYVNGGNDPSFRTFGGNGITAVPTVTTRGTPYIPAHSRRESSKVISTATLPLFDTTDATAGLVPGSSGNGANYYLGGDGNWHHFTSPTPGDTDTEHQLHYRLSVDNTNNNISLSDDEGHTDTVELGVFNSTRDGFVVSSGSNNTEDYYLGGDGAWHHVTTAVRDSEHRFNADSDGLVPRSGDAANGDHYLAGDGTWQQITGPFAANLAGLVNGPTSTSLGSQYYVGRDNVWYAHFTADTDGHTGHLSQLQLLHTDDGELRLGYTYEDTENAIIEALPGRAFAQFTGSGNVPEFPPFTLYYQDANGVNSRRDIQIPDHSRSNRNSPALIAESIAAALRTQTDLVTNVDAVGNRVEWSYVYRGVQQASFPLGGLSPIVLTHYNPTMGWVTRGAAAGMDTRDRRGFDTISEVSIPTLDEAIFTVDDGTVTLNKRTRSVHLAEQGVRQKTHFGISGSGPGNFHRVDMQVWPAGQSSPISRTRNIDGTQNDSVHNSRDAIRLLSSILDEEFGNIFRVDTRNPDATYLEWHTYGRVLGGIGGLIFNIYTDIGNVIYHGQIFSDLAGRDPVDSDQGAWRNTPVAEFQLPGTSDSEFSEWDRGYHAEWNESNTELEVYHNVHHNAPGVRQYMRMTYHLPSDTDQFNTPTIVLNLPGGGTTTLEHAGVLGRHSYEFTNAFEQAIDGDPDLILGDTDQSDSSFRTYFSYADVGYVANPLASSNLGGGTGHTGNVTVQTITPGRDVNDTDSERLLYSVHMSGVNNDELRLAFDERSSRLTLNEDSETMGAQQRGYDLVEKLSNLYLDRNINWTLNWHRPDSSTEVYSYTFNQVSGTYSDRFAFVEAMLNGAITAMTTGANPPFASMSQTRYPAGGNTWRIDYEYSRPGRIFAEQALRDIVGVDADSGANHTLTVNPGNILTPGRDSEEAVLRSISSVVLPNVGLFSNTNSGAVPAPNLTGLDSENASDFYVGADGQWHETFDDDDMRIEYLEDTRFLELGALREEPALDGGVTTRYVIDFNQTGAPNVPTFTLHFRYLDTDGLAQTGNIVILSSEAAFGLDNHPFIQALADKINLAYGQFVLATPFGGGSQLQINNLTIGAIPNVNASTTGLFTWEVNTYDVRQGRQPLLDSEHRAFGVITRVQLPLFDSDTPGLVPEYGDSSPTEAFLRADGSWAVPPGGGADTDTTRDHYFLNWYDSELAIELQDSDRPFTRGRSQHMELSFSGLHSGIMYVNPSITLNAPGGGTIVVQVYATFAGYSGNFVTHFENAIRAANGVTLIEDHPNSNFRVNFTFDEHGSVPDPLDTERIGADTDTTFNVNVITPGSLDTGFNSSITLPTFGVGKTGLVPGYTDTDGRLRYLGNDGTWDDIYHLAPYDSERVYFKDETVEYDNSIYTWDSEIVSLAGLLPGAGHRPAIAAVTQQTQVLFNSVSGDAKVFRLTRPDGSTETVHVDADVRLAQRTQFGARVQALTGFSGFVNPFGAVTVVVTWEDAGPVSGSGMGGIELISGSAVTIQPVRTGTNGQAAYPNHWQLLGTGNTFDTDSTGLVPSPSSSDVADNRFLRADGTWQPVDIETFSVDTDGLVPGPTQNDVDSDKFLNADGTWSNVREFATNRDGVVPGPAASQVTNRNFLGANGWVDYYQGASSISTSLRVPPAPTPLPPAPTPGQLNADSFDGFLQNAQYSAGEGGDFDSDYLPRAAQFEWAAQGGGPNTFARLHHTPYTWMPWTEFPGGQGISLLDLVIRVPTAHPELTALVDQLRTRISNSQSLYMVAVADSENWGLFSLTREDANYYRIVDNSRQVGFRINQDNLLEYSGRPGRNMSFYFSIDRYGGGRFTNTNVFVNDLSQVYRDGAGNWQAIGNAGSGGGGGGGSSVAVIEDLENVSAAARGGIFTRQISNDQYEIIPTERAGINPVTPLPTRAYNLQANLYQASGQTINSWRALNGSTIEQTLPRTWDWHDHASSDLFLRMYWPGTGNTDATAVSTWINSGDSDNERLMLAYSGIGNWALYDLGAATAGSIISPAGTFLQLSLGSRGLLASEGAPQGETRFFFGIEPTDDSEITLYYNETRDVASRYLGGDLQWHSVVSNEAVAAGPMGTRTAASASGTGSVALGYGAVSDTDDEVRIGGTLGSTNVTNQFDFQTDTASAQPDNIVRRVDTLGITSQMVWNNANTQLQRVVKTMPNGDVFTLLMNWQVTPEVLLSVAYYEGDFSTGTPGTAVALKTLNYNSASVLIGTTITAP